jgi:hypothetical protein
MHTLPPDPWFAALCSIAGPIAAAHPDWTPDLVAREADAIAQACSDRCEARWEAARADASYAPVVYVSSAVGQRSETLEKWLREQLAAMGFGSAPGAA